MATLVQDLRLRFSKSSYDIPESKGANVEALIKDAVLGSNYIIPIDKLQAIINTAQTIPTAATLFLQLVKIFDTMGSHPIQVFKSLSIMSFCLRNNPNLFSPIGRYFIPEIQTLLYLSFQDRNGTFRDSIHALSIAIYDNLMYKAELPENPDISQARPKRKYVDDAPTSIPNAPLSSDFDSNENELPDDFDPFKKVVLPPPTPLVYAEKELEPFPTPPKAMPEPESIPPPSEPEPEPIPPPSKPEPEPLSLKPGVDPRCAELQMNLQMKFIKKTIYDSTIESL